MNILIYIAIVFVTFALMEFVAWFAHKYIMHGFLWTLHKDHHRKEPGFFEKNDAFFLIFASPAIASFYFATQHSIYWLMAIGIGITLYGSAYFLVHEVFIHQRFKWFRKTDNAYLRAIRKAHYAHHSHLDKEDGESFGMLLAPAEFFRTQMPKDIQGNNAKSASK